MAHLHTRPAYLLQKDPGFYPTNTAIVTRQPRASRKESNAETPNRLNNQTERMINKYDTVDSFIKLIGMIIFSKLGERLLRFEALPLELLFEHLPLTFNLLVLPHLDKPTLFGLGTSAPF